MRYLLLTIITGFGIIGKCASIDSIQLSYDRINTNEIRVTLYNNSNSIVYLFDSYIKDNIYKSKYLHRYNEQDSTYKLSLIPLLPYLRVDYISQIYEKYKDLNSCVSYGNVVYSFQAIKQHSSYSFTLNIQDVFTDCFITDIDLREIDYLPPKNIFKNSQIVVPVDNNKIKLELAIYSNVDIITNLDAYRFDFYNYNNQVKDYRLLSLILYNDVSQK